MGRSSPVGAAASAEDNLVGEVASLDTRPEINDMHSRSAATSPYDGSSRRRVEYTWDESFASRTKFSGPIGGNFPESPVHQLPMLGFGAVGDSHS
jgi:hypothetical protein